MQCIIVPNRSNRALYFLDRPRAPKVLLGAVELASQTATVAPVDFERDPSSYVHWKLTFDGAVATLSMDVQEDAGLSPDYRLKLNSYDLGVDIELADAIQRLRFEHPEVARRRHHEPEGAHLLRRREHLHAARLDARVEGELLQVHQRDAARDRGRERALRPQVPRGARTASAPAAATSSRSRATRSCSSTTATPRSACRRRRCSACCPAPAASRASSTSARSGATSPTSSARSPKASRASARSSGGSSTRCIRRASSRSAVAKRARGAGGDVRSARRAGPGIALGPLDADGHRRRRSRTRRCRSTIDRDKRVGDADDRRRPTAPQPSTPDEILAAGDQFWPLRAFRELDDALLRLRVNEPVIGTVVVQDRGRSPTRCSRSTRRCSRIADALARARDRPLHQAHAEAPGPHRAQLLRVHRAGQLLRRLAVRARARRRSLVHARRSRSSRTRSRCRR